MTAEDAKTKAIDWLTGQSFNNVMLLLILLCGGWGSRFLVTQAIPAHLQQIRDGYNEIDEKHRTERAVIRDQFDIWLERILAEKIHTAGNKVPGNSGSEL